MRNDYSSWGSLKGDSPRNHRGRQGSDQYEVPNLSPEGNLFDFLRESDSVKRRASGSFKRRRSFEGRLQNKDFITANGSLCRNNSDNTSHHRASWHLKPEKDGASVPSIIVDSPISDACNNQEPPTETDRLLHDTSAPGNSSAKDDKPSSADSFHIPMEPVGNVDDESHDPYPKYTGAQAKLVQSISDTMI